MSMEQNKEMNREHGPALAAAASRALYTPEERIKRDQSVWTLVQGVLAPIQFLVFLVSLVLVLRYLATGEGQNIGCIWEKVVFDCYLFAPAFYWEDVFSMLVLALHTAYLAALATDALTTQQLMYLALAAYATYVVNAGQFIWKLRIARLDHAREQAVMAGRGAAA